MNAHFSSLFHPGSIGETAVIESWLRHIPLLPVGRPKGTERGDGLEEVRYAVSRLADIISYSNVLGRQFRVLAIVKQDHHKDIEQFCASFKENTGASLYIPQINENLYDRAIIVGEARDNPESVQSSDMASRTLAQQRFLGEFNKTIEVLAAESLLSDEAVQTITEIVTRLRKHPDVVHGPSVRGTLAFYEILESSCLKGDLSAIG